MLLSVLPCFMCWTSHQQQSSLSTASPPASPFLFFALTNFSQTLLHFSKHDSWSDKHSSGSATFHCRCRSATCGCGGLRHIQCKKNIFSLNWRILMGIFLLCYLYWRTGASIVSRGLMEIVVGVDTFFVRERLFKPQIHYKLTFPALHKSSTATWWSN